ncbi:hypothetical protein BDW02DRAFT_572350 [Decorospora gaudefroyi]|uniref:Uncharacterized protein n=1 Tax=Decorospora gaudefroyi TaxID=184978 RepID=A0A6A5K1B6_9PLEO|nr:hypothetical protein BDW02DRAFT_572350 [Decorospora gaudefroyi]
MASKRNPPPASNPSQTFLPHQQNPNPEPKNSSIPTHNPPNPHSKSNKNSLLVCKQF